MFEYIAPPETDAEAAQRLARNKGFTEAILICRRGIELGWVAAADSEKNTGHDCLSKLWARAHAIYLAQFISTELESQQANIQQSLQLMEDVLEDKDIETILDNEPYTSRLSPRFTLLPAGIDPSDEQEIVRLDFDAYQGEQLLAEDLWMKLSWLSYDDEDCSLRFRFSFGIEGYENVAAQWQKQQLAAQLTEAVFPESELISGNSFLRGLLGTIIGVDDVAYVERIIYFNAPNGGAQFHQDVERGHLGVVFAQLHGRTAWLALSKASLVKEVMDFLSSESGLSALRNLAIKPEAESLLLEKAKDAAVLSAFFDDPESDVLDTLLNRSAEFFSHLVQQGYGYLLSPGDVLLLPQQSHEHCAWHSVFCADDYPGHALSFAIREQAT